MSDATRFPAAKTLKVDDLLQVYDGIIEAATGTLELSRIAVELPVPESFDALDGHVRWIPGAEDPLPPPDLTAVGPLVLGQLFSFFQNWTNYVAAQGTRAKSVRDVQERHLKVVKSALTIFYKEEKGVPVSSIDDYINTDERFVLVDAALLKIKVFYETATSREDQLKRTLNNISREQTRRKEELEREKERLEERALQAEEELARLREEKEAALEAAQ
jgi:hypothetical protein